MLSHKKRAIKIAASPLQISDGGKSRVIIKGESRVKRGRGLMPVREPPFYQRFVDGAVKKVMIVAFH